MSLTPKQREILSLTVFPPAPEVGYRVESNIMAGPDTVTDIIEFETEELGNVEEYKHITSETLEILRKYPAEDAIWVTRTREQAKYYLSEGEPESYIQEIQLPKGSIILNDIGDQGILVLLHPLDKYKRGHYVKNTRTGRLEATIGEPILGKLPTEDQLEFLKYYEWSDKRNAWVSKKGIDVVKGPWQAAENIYLTLKGTT